MTLFSHESLNSTAKVGFIPYVLCDEGVEERLIFPLEVFEVEVVHEHGVLFLSDHFFCNVSVVSYRAFDVLEVTCVGIIIWVILAQFKCRKES
jgi:hypothetical protein